MDWERAIELNRQALLRFVRQMIALLGVAPETGVERLPRPVYFALLALLRPVESGLRRLILVRTMLIAAVSAPPGSRLTGDRRATTSGRAAKGRGAPVFPLFDPRKNFEPHIRRNPRFPPRITMLGVDDWTPYPRPALRDPDAPVAAMAACRRLWAVQRALADLDAQARRMLRQRLSKQARREAGKPPKFDHPLRPGYPPGQRGRQRGAVHWMLTELDGLARHAERTARPG